MKEYPIGTHNRNIVYYTDDVMLADECEHNLQRLLYYFIKSGKELNLALPIQKTKNMTLSSHSVRCILATSNKPAEQVSLIILIVNNRSVVQAMKIKYLGVHSTSWDRLERE